MEMNSANVEEVVKQVLESMLKTPVSAAPAAASKSQAIPETAHVAMLTALEHYDIKEFPMPEVGDGDILVKSIKTRIYTLDDDTEVFPGHGGQSSVGYEKKYNIYIKD